MEKARVASEMSGLPRVRKAALLGIYIIIFILMVIVIFILL